MTHLYEISGMTCNSCVARVKSELLKLGDIESADVQLTSPQATISMAKHISTATLQNAVSRAGPYTIREQEGPSMHKGMEENSDNDNDTPSYYPIYLIFGYIGGVSLLVQLAGGGFHLMQWMSYFMGGFFLVFSFFKLLDLRGFADGYHTYDVVAKRLPAWGYLYPFVELALGLAFITGFAPLGTSIVAFVVMGVSSVGVIQNLLKKSPFQCACLGTVIKLPLSKVTLVEDLLMVVMSGVMVLVLA